MKAALPPETTSRLPPPGRAAFLLDLDGTLIDIAPAPDLVVVPADLPPTLRWLRALCGDALAVVTGRPLTQVDQLLGDVPYAVAGEHGTAIRPAPGAAPVWVPLPDPPALWRAEAERLAARHPGVLVESKRHGFVLHYRQAPEAGEALHAALSALVREQADAFHLLAAKMAWEVRPAGTDKGSAVEALMRAAPFAGRLPIFIGDDVTDEDGMRAAEAVGGLGLRVPDLFGDAAGVRRWLARLAGGNEVSWGG